MQQIVAHERCVGCGACMNRCPKQCITMVKAKGGFLYPSIDQSLCVDCGHCQTVCPALHHEAYAAEPLPKAYVAHNLEDGALEHCSSGGIFQLLAQDTLQRGGAVFGAAFNDSFQVTHRLAETWEEAKEFQSSKYVQSTIGTAYRQTKSILDSGRPVLFTGTPCQISGLKLFLGKDEPHFLLSQETRYNSIDGFSESTRPTNPISRSIRSRSTRTATSPTSSRPPTPTTTVTRCSDRCVKTARTSSGSIPITRSTPCLAETRILSC